MNFQHISRSVIAVILGVLCLVTNIGCKKFLDKKSSIGQAVPRTIADLQALLDNSVAVNSASSADMAELAADNYFLTDADFQFLASGTSAQQTWVKQYTWDGAVIDQSSGDWISPYTGPIYYSNIVLDQLPNILQQPADTSIIKALKGSALFYRSFAFWSLAQVYCRPYGTEYNATPGVMLRLTSDAGVPIGQRATVGETYDRIITDLKEAASLLPQNTTVSTRPCQAAAYAMLSRVYLSMRDYANAAYYSNQALLQRSVLMEYNSIPSIPSPTNVEVIFDDVEARGSGFVLVTGFGYIDTLLYQSYDSNDLRKTLFFRPSNGYQVFQGWYRATMAFIWDGLATDELYLTRAECAARSGNKDSAMADLNWLMRTRWNDMVPYPTITATDAQDALAKVLVERRKELVYRGLRWTDIRRLNLENANITLKRMPLGQTYTLPPNDPRTVFLIPQDEINNSGIQQNPR